MTERFRVRDWYDFPFSTLPVEVIVHTQLVVLSVPE